MRITNNRYIGSIGGIVFSTFDQEFIVIDHARALDACNLTDMREGENIIYIYQFVSLYLYLPLNGKPV